VTPTAPASTSARESGGLCSELSARRGLPLVGSAGCYDAILAFELEPPWTARIVGSRACDAALDRAIEFAQRKGRRIRLVALEPEARPEVRPEAGPQARRDTTRVLWLSHDSHEFAAFSRREYAVARKDLAATIEQLASNGTADTLSLPCAPGQRDLFVCTHGARDACCGKFGFPLYRELCRLAERAGAGGAVRIWRSSHLGGHRFAPTLLDLPSGRMFGRVSLADAAAIHDGGDALARRLESIYRGRCVLPEPVQIVERDLWIEAGAPFEHAVLTWSMEASGELWQVDLAARSIGAEPGDTNRTWQARANVARASADQVTTPSSCGRDPEVEAPWKILG
jgi:hypothetical protein